MRPVAVTMVGFGTFLDEVTVDFEGAEVFALVGPTGSGKSTVIDAICFALYGSLPRYADRRAVGAAVHTLAAEARVSLTFDLGDHRYVAVRVVRRDKHGKASTKEARLERSDGEVLAGTAKEMEPVVTQVIGLDFDQFTRAVVLPQGDFARFLHDKPAARQDLLVQLLGLDVYERMMQRARALAAAESLGLERDRARIMALAHAAPERVQELTDELAAVSAARESWRAVAGDAASIVSDVAAAEGAAGTSRERVEVLGAVRPPDGLTRLAEAITEADTRLAAAETAAETATETVNEVEARIAALGDPQALQQLKRTRDELDAIQRRLEPLRRKQAEAEAEAARLDGIATQAEEHAGALRTANAAHVVREHLVVGDPCPVCEQVVTAPPSGDAPEAWRAARTAADAARQSAQEARDQATRAGIQCDEADKLRQQLMTALADAPAADVIDAHLAEIAALERARNEARAEEKQCRAAAREAADAAKQARVQAERARSQYRECRDRCAAVGLTAPSETDDLGRDWAALTAWAAERLAEATAALTEATGRVEKLQGELSARLDAVVVEAAALGLAVDAAAGFDGLVDAATHAEATTRHRLEGLNEEVAERRELEAAIEERSATAAVAGELGRLLDANHFERWLVSEALSRLVEGASRRFGDLSGGRYSFAFEDSGRDLLVVDHSQGDEARSVRTLSGGETFQASLALALSLSDQLADLSADRSSRLESIFLDEGFGTLDAETLDVVAETIENLGATDRMVGIVTHVAELAARMPVQFRVTKTARSSTVERITT